MFEDISRLIPDLNVWVVGLSLSALIVIGHYIYRWLVKALELPWMNEENQRIRQQLIKEWQKK